MLSCKDITEQANSYLEKELSFSKRLSVRVHLFMCVHCRRYIEQLHITIQTLGRMKKEEPVDPEYSNHLVECFKKEKPINQQHDSD
ncbi:zf-HC2 domain-containing protein [Kaarinaea lacus]